MLRQVPRLRAVYGYCRLPNDTLLSQRRFLSEKTPSRPQSKYATEIKNFVSLFKKELGAVQASQEKDSMKRKVEEQEEMQKMLQLNKLENKKIALLR